MSKGSKDSMKTITDDWRFIPNWQSQKLHNGYLLHIGVIHHKWTWKTAFLNGELDEEIYTDQLGNYWVLSEKNKESKLHKFLYDLKQTLKQLYKKFKKRFNKFGFSSKKVESRVFTKMQRSQ